MRYPTVEDIFLTFEFCDETNGELKDMNLDANSLIDRIINEKTQSNADAERLRELKNEIESESQMLGFKQGFYFAVKLLFNL